MNNVLVENIDYELIPQDESENWSIRILKGDFVETVIQFGMLRVAEDGESMKYDFNVIQSPNDEAVIENDALQELAGDVLFSILNSMGTELNSMGTEAVNN